MTTYKSRKRSPEEVKNVSLNQIRENWNWGVRDKRMRGKFIALLRRVGKPSQAWQLLDDLELWGDEKRPPKMGDLYPYSRWLRAAEDGVVPDKKTQTVVDQRYDAYMGEALLRASTVAAETAVDQFKKVQQGDFNEKYSGIVQHAQNMAVMGYEKVMQARRPQKEAAKIQFAPSFSLVAPPNQPAQLKEGIIEGEVTEVGN